MVKSNFTTVTERIASLETDNKNQSSKINDIHKILVGNGRIGLVDEWNQWKGGIKFFGVIVGFLISTLGVVVGFLAYSG